MKNTILEVLGFLAAFLIIGFFLLAGLSGAAGRKDYEKYMEMNHVTYEQAVDAFKDVGNPNCAGCNYDGRLHKFKGQ